MRNFLASGSKNEKENFSDFSFMSHRKEFAVSFFLLSNKGNEFIFSFPHPSKQRKNDG